MSPFLQHINYSSSNEDGRSECRALRLGSSDTVLCITGSGARALDLLTQGPAQVVSVDINPCQSHLLRLKLAALRFLPYDAFLAFLGVTASDRRQATYGHLRAQLPEATRRFWDARDALLARGVLYAGRWERHFRSLARLVGTVRPAARRRLFAAATVDEQAACWARWDDATWRAFLRVVTARTVWKHVLRDPGFYRHVPPEVDVAATLGAYLARAARTVIFRESAFTTLLFYGAYRPGGPLPLHLERAHYESLQRYAGRVRVVTGNLLGVLAQTDTRFSAFSLSDIASYTDPATYAQLWEAVARTATPGARVCERQFLVQRDAAPEAAGLVRDRALEATLQRTDRSLFYAFVAGRLDPGRDPQPSMVTARSDDRQRGDS